ncbi:MAG TPA: S53 family peptidase [Burkholderiaceae bacterium]|nr:S53 family peptidase [Burkholderiaceae bacterium]
MAHRPLRGSEREIVEGARSLGKADPAQRLQVTIVLKRQSSAVLMDHIARVERGDRRARPMTREDFAHQFGMRPEHLAAIRKFAAAYGLTVRHENAARRTVVLEGTVAQCNAAFGVDLQQFDAPAGPFRGRTGAVQLPEELHEIVDAVLGLDNRPQAKPHFRHRPAGPASAAAQASASFTPPQLAQLYDFPAGNGQGQTIALIELGGGYRAQDVAAYFGELGIAQPPLLAVAVDGASNEPSGDPNGPDGEVELDIEVAGAIAPGASIVVYFAPNTDAGFLDAVSTAVHDTTNKPSVVSISWGGPESSWTQQAMMAIDQVLQEAAVLGVTVCVASGDSGSSDGVADGSAHVDFPASSSYALACGGTSLRASGQQIASETVWNDGTQGGASGGGVSAFFALPKWQTGLQVHSAQGGISSLTRRGVPDVAGDADPRTGYDVRVDGSDAVIGGTSAVAPLWAALIARINSTRGTPAGLVQPLLYSTAGLFNDITSGNNGMYAAAVGWDACTGLGSPKGKAIATALAAPAGS